MRDARGFDNGTSKGILKQLKTVYLRLRKTEVEGVAVIKFRVNSGGGDG